MADEAVRAAELDVMRVQLPGGGSARVLVDGEFGPRQIRALIKMLEVTAEFLDESEGADAGRAALAGEGGGDAEQ